MYNVITHTHNKHGISIFTKHYPEGDLHAAIEKLVELTNEWVTAGEPQCCKPVFENKAGGFEIAIVTMPNTPKGYIISIR